MRMQRYRRKRRLNLRRLLVVLTVLCLAALLLLTIVRTGFFGLIGPAATATASADDQGGVAGDSGKAHSSSGDAEGLDAGTTDGANPGETVSSDPTPVPAATPRPTPDPVRDASTDTQFLKVDWQTPAVFDGENAWPDSAVRLEMQDGAYIDTWLLRNGQPATVEEAAAASNPISFGTGDAYAQIDGVLAFRGNNFRDDPTYGTRLVTQKKLEIVWTKSDGVVSGHGSTWPGSGWTGQPLLVHWPEATRQAMNIRDEFRSTDLVEVIYPVFDGNVYFLDLKTGEETRDPIESGFPFKGTAAVDPRGYPLLYAGQGLNENGNRIGEYKYHIYSLIDQTELHALYGIDSAAFRSWGAFDSSALFSAEADTLVACGENGLVNRIRLNSAYDPVAGTLSIAPQNTQYRYRASYTDELGIENSPAAYGEYIWFNDNGGTMQCLNINTMKPLWIRDTGDDTDSTTTLEKENENLWLYTANQVDKRHAEAGSTQVASNIRKMNAMTGEILWQVDIPCVYQFYINGGVLGTPLMGKNDISDIVIYTVCLTSSNDDGKMIALDKKTGNIVWERNLNVYSWCSPVAVLSDDGKTWGIFADRSGVMHLFDPKTGQDVDTLSLGGNVESSPAVYDDMIVVGSYAQKIFGIRIQ